MYVLTHEALFDITAEPELDTDEVSDTLTAFVAMLDQHKNATATTAANQNHVRGPRTGAAVRALETHVTTTKKSAWRKAARQTGAASSVCRYQLRALWGTRFSTISVVLRALPLPLT